MKARHNGQVSFNLRDGFERRLYEHARKPDHGEFSKYIKRLIERDLRAEDASLTPQAGARETAEDIEVSAFL